jgi:hypothetical protein
MKALTFRPHWAWFVANGYKDVENRSWPTRVRGRVWIHASSKGVTSAEYERFPMKPMKAAIDQREAITPEAKNSRAAVAACCPRFRFRLRCCAAICPRAED